MVSLVDTNVLVYAHDPRDPGKQLKAREVLDQGIREGSLRLPHQAVVEFVAAVTRSRKGTAPLLDSGTALRKADALLRAFDVLYPNATVMRTAFAGVAVHRLSWYDAHLWACAEAHGIPEILTEDFQHGARYGGVRIVNPFL